MERGLIFLVSLTLLVTVYPLDAKTVASKVPAPAPAPAPEAHSANLTYLLTYAGPFQTFLNLLESTQVLETFQAQANNTEEGITLFAPQDSAFSSLKKNTVSNLTQLQLKSLCLFHALSHYYSLSDFKNLSQLSPVLTLAGGQYTLNFTDVSGTIHLSSGWTNTKISSSVVSTAPVAIYEINKVLLPEAIFGTDIPPTPAPAPAPEKTPVADSPAEEAEKAPSSGPPAPSSSPKMMGMSDWSHIVFAILGGYALMML